MANYASTDQKKIELETSFLCLSLSCLALPSLLFSLLLPSFPFPNNVFFCQVLPPAKYIYVQPWV